MAAVSNHQVSRGQAQTNLDKVSLSTESNYSLPLIKSVSSITGVCVTLGIRSFLFLLHLGVSPRSPGELRTSEMVQSPQSARSLMRLLCLLSS